MEQHTDGTFTDDYGDIYNEYGDIIHEHIHHHEMDDDDKADYLKNSEHMPDFAKIVNTKMDNGELDYQQAVKEYHRLTENYVNGRKFQQQLDNDQQAESQQEIYHPKSNDILVDNRDHAFRGGEREFLDDVGKPRPKKGTFGFRRKDATRRVNNAPVPVAKMVKGVRQRTVPDNIRQRRYTKDLTKKRHAIGQYNIRQDSRTLTANIRMNPAELALLNQHYGTEHTVYYMAQHLVNEVITNLIDETEQ